MTEHTEKERARPLGPVQEAIALQKRLARQDTPDEADVAKLCNLVESTPALWRQAITTGPGIRRWLIHHTVQKDHRALMLAEESAIKAQFGYDAAPPIEQLLLEHVLLARTRVLSLEMVYNAKWEQGGLTPRTAAFWDKMLGRAHRRFLDAVEALARVRKLCQNLPQIQINVAQGAQQVNNVSQVELPL